VCRYVYVGQTIVDFSTRYQSHPFGSHKYAILNRASDDLSGIALYVLDAGTPRSMYYLAEQIMVLLLGTYKAFMRGGVPDGTTMGNSDSSYWTNKAAAQYCLRISKKVFQVTGYVTALECEGLEFLKVRTRVLHWKR
jgi:hypothetical protein